MTLLLARVAIGSRLCSHNREELQQHHVGPGDNRGLDSRHQHYDIPLRMCHGSLDDEINWPGQHTQNCMYSMHTNVTVQTSLSKTFHVFRVSCEVLNAVVF